MKRGRRALLILSGGGLLAVIAWLAFRDQEPSYNGKTLTEWLEHPNHANGPTEYTAITEMGTNALRCAMRWLNEPAPWKERMLLASTHLPKFVEERVSDSIGIGARKCNQHALNVFQIFGSEAKPAIPELVEIVGCCSTNRRSANAVYALSCIGKDAVPSLLDILGNSSYPPSLRALAGDMVGSLLERAPGGHAVNSGFAATTTNGYHAFWIW